MTTDMMMKKEDLHQRSRQMNHQVEVEGNDEMDRIIPVPLLARSHSRQTVSAEDDLKVDDLAKPCNPQKKEDPAIFGFTKVGRTYTCSPTSYAAPTPPPSKTKPSTHLTRTPTSRSTARGSNLTIRNTDKIGHILFRHLKFVGPGLVNSVAYFDPQVVIILLFPYAMYRGWWSGTLSIVYVTRIGGQDADERVSIAFFFDMFHVLQPCLVPEQRKLDGRSSSGFNVWVQIIVRHPPCWIRGCL
jgi:hypothetical protein